MGGIEKFNRAFCKALWEISLEKGHSFLALSAYDAVCDERYLKKENFRGFNKSKLLFSLYFLFHAFRSEIIIVGHINLAPLGLLIKLLSPRKKLLLVTHGIEVWDALSFVKKYFLKRCDTILSVSDYTAEKIKRNHGIPGKKIVIFPNTLDPYFAPFSDEVHRNNLRQRHGLSGNEKIVLTVGRISSSEKYKGYDKVLAALPEVLKSKPHLKYMLVGKSDEREYNRLQGLIMELKIRDSVILPGYASEEDLVGYYSLSDVFIMTSKKEGFGIVFIEALTCGLPVIAGNQDGSKEALMHGKLGTLVDPDDVKAISLALLSELENSNNEPDFLKTEVYKAFGFTHFKGRLEKILQN